MITFILNILVGYITPSLKIELKKISFNSFFPQNDSCGGRLPYQQSHINMEIRVTELHCLIYVYTPYQQSHIQMEIRESKLHYLLIYAYTKIYPVR